MFYTYISLYLSFVDRITFSKIFIYFHVVSLFRLSVCLNLPLKVHKHISPVLDFVHQTIFVHSKSKFTFNRIKYAFSVL